LKWKLVGIIVAVIAVSILTINALNYYSYIQVDIGAITIAGSIISILTPFVLYFADYVQKSRVDMQIKNAEFLAKGFDHSYIGYQLRAQVINKGRKNCLDLDDISVLIKDREGNSPTLLKVNKKMTDSHGEITLDNEQMRDIGHCWMDKKDRIKTSLTEIRQDDPYYLVFPCETNWGV
jgi:hypothetical protein